MIPLMLAVEHLLAEYGVTEPGAGAANHEAPAGELLDAVYTAWNNEMRVKFGNPDAIFEPEGKPVYETHIPAPPREADHAA